MQPRSHEATRAVGLGDWSDYYERPDASCTASPEYWGFCKPTFFLRMSIRLSHAQLVPSMPLLSSFSLASKGFPSVCLKSVCVRLHSENSEPTMLISQTRPDKHPPTPPLCRWPSFSSFGAACDVELFRSSGLFKHTLMAVCTLPEHQW